MITLQRTISGKEVSLASEIAQRYQLASLKPLIDSSRSLLDRDELSVAVIGRFKAGKSSFLNHFLDRNLLPVGVTPVTAVVTEIGYGERAHAVVHFRDGHTQEVALTDIHHFIAESENPGNKKQVSLLKIELPQLAQMRALRFVDMPGLESALAHNTETAMSWLPNVALALVAVSVDPPLSQHDVTLLESIYEYTPNVSILLTKVDLLTESELAEVIGFVNERLVQTFGSAPPIFPYSVRPGHEYLKAQVQDTLIKGTLAQFEELRGAVLVRKLETLLCECHDYLMLALKSAETVGSEREALERLVASEKEALVEMKSELRLVIRHAAGGTRAAVAKHLESYERELNLRMSLELKTRLPDWSRSLRLALESFEQWLSDSLAKEMMAISAKERMELLAPLERLEKEVFRNLQNFRDRLSGRTERAFGVPLRTSEQEIKLGEPHTPDIYIGRVFDRNWELLSPVLPMSLVGPLVRRHFNRMLPYMIEKNLSRLATQWDESIRSAMAELVTEAQRRIDDLLATVGHLIATASHDAPRIRLDLERLNSARQAIQISVYAK